MILSHLAHTLGKRTVTRSNIPITGHLQKFQALIYVLTCWLIVNGKLMCKLTVI